MIDTQFATGWTVGPKRGLWDSMIGLASQTQTVDLPHDAMLGSARSADATAGTHSGYYPGGTVEYLKTFSVPEEYRGRTVHLELEGVHRDAMVFLNDTLVAQRPNGYARFVVDLDPYLRYGQDNRLRVEARAEQDSRWYTGLGIHRGVALHVQELVHIPVDGVRVTTPDITAERAVVAVETVTANAGRGTTTAVLTTEAVDADGVVRASDTRPVTLLPGDSAPVRQQLYVADPQLWDVDSPALYTLRSRLTVEGEGVDSADTTFGIRSLHLSAREGLRVNGRPVKLRGACVHHDNGILGSRSLPDAEERRIRLLKEAGFNAVRSSHNPMSIPMLDACDRLGMLVMDESFDVWTEAKTAHDYSLAFSEWWRRDVESMVRKDFNHPSVIFYSIGNEIPETGTAHGARLGRAIAEHVRALDPTRFTTNSVNGIASVIRELSTRPELTGAGAAAPQEQGVNDMMTDMGEAMKAIDPLVSARIEESLSVVDAAGLNYGESRYVTDHERYPNRVIIGTETYPGGIARNWALVTEHDHVIGDFTWTGWDYLGEAGLGRVTYDGDEPSRGTAGPFPWLLAWCGDIDITGHRRPASYYREIVFGLREQPYLAVRRPEREGVASTSTPWAWSDSVASWTWPVEPGSPVTVEVYSASPEVELRLDGRVIGRQPTGPDHAFRTAFTTTYQPGELIAVAYDGDREVSRSALRTADAATVGLQVTVDRAELSGAGLAHVEIGLADDEGRVVTGADAPVTVAVEGPGRLLGLGSARPDTREGYAGPSHTTFDGRALAVVQATGPGTVVVTVSADDHAPRTVTLPSR